MTTKRVSLAALVSLLAAATLGLAQTPSSEPAQPSGEQLQPQPQVPSEQHLRAEDAKVVSVDPKSSSLTVKVGNDERKVTLDEKSAAVLKVIRAGDDVRLLMKDDGRAGGVVITNPNNEGYKVRR
jgi:hypothetical protein